MDREITYTLVVIEKFILDLLKGLCYEMAICLLYRLHTAILNRPLSSAATKEV